MSKNLERVIQRAISDAAFRRQLQANPEATLRGLDLTQAEVAALRSGDAGKLTSLGIDQRMSKTFTFGGEGLASRAAIGGDLTTGQGGVHTERDLRVNDEVVGARSTALDAENTSGSTRSLIPNAGGTSPAFDPGAVVNEASVGDPMSAGSTRSATADPENAAHARGYLGGQTDVASSAQAAPVEGSPEEFAFRDQGASAARGSIIADPDNPAYARGYIGEQGASATTASNMADPENAAHARGYLGGQTDVASSAQAAPTEGSPEEFAFRDQGTTASNIADPENPAMARGYIGGGSPSDAFLTEGEVSQYSGANVASGNAEDEGELFNPNASDATPDDASTASVHHEPDVPS